MRLEFEHICRERTGAEVRRVSLMVPDIPHMLDVVQKMQQVPNFLPKENPMSPFVDPDCFFFEVDDVGLIAVKREQTWCHVHITFWDRILRGRETLCATLAEWVKVATGLPMYTVIPKDARTILAFSKRVGFVEVAEHGDSVTLQFVGNPNYPE